MRAERYLHVMCSPGPLLDVVLYQHPALGLPGVEVLAAVCALLLLLLQLCRLPDKLQLLLVLDYSWWQEICQLCCSHQQLAALFCNDGCLTSLVSTPGVATMNDRRF